MKNRWFFLLRLLLFVLLLMSNIVIFAQDDDYDDDYEDDYSEEYDDYDEGYDDCEGDECDDFYYDDCEGDECDDFYYDDCEGDECDDFYYDDCEGDECDDFYYDDCEGDECDDFYYDDCEGDECDDFYYDDCEGDECDDFYYDDCEGDECDDFYYDDCEGDECDDFYYDDCEGDECDDFYYDDFVYCETDEECEVLYAECESDPECIIFYEDEFGDLIESDDFADNYDPDTESEEPNAEDVLARFDVDGINLIGEPSSENQQLWDTFTRLIPQTWANNISAFEVINDPETSGYVYADENDPTKFVLALNVSELSNPTELNHTIIHEFAHILTLNPQQVSGVLAMGSGASCSTLELDEGCTNEQSYVNQFNSQFASAGTGNINTDFVSEYASTNIAEDIAESFTAFVLRDKPEGNSIADQKINFFYNYPELIQLRQQIRNNIAQ